MELVAIALSQLARLHHRVLVAHGDVDLTRPLETGESVLVHDTCRDMTSWATVSRVDPQHCDIVYELRLGGPADSVPGRDFGDRADSHLGVHDVVGLLDETRARSVDTTPESRRPAFPMIEP